jgi:hypothetical protein
MRDYRASTMMKMNHYFILLYHPSLFLLPHLSRGSSGYYLFHSSSGGITG